MEKVETDISGREGKPEWYYPNLKKNRELMKKYRADPDYLPELHSQIGYSETQKDFVFFDVGFESGLDSEQIKRNRYNWPGNTLDLVERSRKNLHRAKEKAA